MWCAQFGRHCSVRARLLAHGRAGMRRLDHKPGVCLFVCLCDCFAGCTLYGMISKTMLRGL